MLAEAATGVPGLRFVNTGTVWQHFDAAPYSPVSLYAATKQAFADILVFYGEVAGLSVHTIELMDTYGRDDPRAKLIPFLLRAGAEGTTVEMTDGTQLIDLVHVDDAVGALHRDRGRTGGRDLRRAGRRRDHVARAGGPLPARHGVDARHPVGRTAGTTARDAPPLDDGRAAAGVDPADPARRRAPQPRRLSAPGVSSAVACRSARRPPPGSRRRPCRRGGRTARPRAAVGTRCSSVPRPTPPAGSRC